jgi:hypothetical protein
MQGIAIRNAASLNRRVSIRQAILAQPIAYSPSTSPSFRPARVHKLLFGTEVIDFT